MRRLHRITDEQRRERAPRFSRMDAAALGAVGTYRPSDRAAGTPSCAEVDARPPVVGSEARRAGRSAWRAISAGLRKCLTSLVTAAALLGPAMATAGDLRDRPPEDETIYFLLPDRFENADRTNDTGGLKGDRLATGFDPTDKAFYHGGDLRGVTARLDYIQSLGATAIWLAPIYKNKPVQGAPGHESAGYHGYWITDFTTVDPHFGTTSDLQDLVTAAHARGIKIFLDIVTNHTADVIAYRECARAPCAYRSRADYPYTRRGGINGLPINDGFLGDAAAYQTEMNFARLTRPDYAYTPFVPVGAEHAKVPDWLNNPIYYHNRGDSTFNGESSTMGDFAGLDDLMTENPRVLRGFVDIYGAWIERFGIDGFRIDTAKHVNPEFWSSFVPAMQLAANRRGIPNFYIFGEVSTAQVDPGLLALHTRRGGLPAVLDFAFANAVRDTVAGTRGTDELARLFEADALYEGGAATAMKLPTFISNHDGGRFAHFVRATWPGASDSEVLNRVALAHAMLFTLRGVPVVYYGDEQGFSGLGGDQDARQDMFESRVPSYVAEHEIGSRGPGERLPFDRSNSLYVEIARLARIRADHAALRHGRQVVRQYADSPGLFAVSRFDPADGREYLIVFNTSTRRVTGQVEVEASSTNFESVLGSCPALPSAPASLRISLDSLSFAVCAAGANH